MVWQRAPNRSIALKKEIEIVAEIMTANLLKKISLAPKSETPHPKVVIVPLRMLTPISE